MESKLQTQVQLANVIEDNDNSPKITRDKLNELHQNHKKTNAKNEGKVRKIVDILGGIDSILDIYLAVEYDMKLTQSQIQRLYEILTEDEDTNDTHDSYKRATYTFYTSDTIIHQGFGIEIGNKIIEYIWHKVTLSIMVLINGLLIIWGIIILATNSISTSFNVYKLLIGIANTFWALILMFSVNKTLFLSSIKHFMFWFKTITALEVAILYFVWVYHIVDHEEIWGNDDENDTFHIISESMFIIPCMCLVLIFSSIDGYNLSWTTKLFGGICVSSLSTVISVYLTFNAQKVDASVIGISDNFHVSVVAIIASACRVLSIFFWRQTFVGVVRTGKSVNIRHRPYIVWIDK